MDFWVIPCSNCIPLHLKDGILVLSIMYNYPGFGPYTSIQVLFCILSFMDVWQVSILCNDCNETSTTAFHIVGLKCSHCRSYNTRRISTPDDHWEVWLGCQYEWWASYTAELVEGIVLFWQILLLFSITVRMIT